MEVFTYGYESMEINILLKGLEFKCGMKMKQIL